MTVRDAIRDYLPWLLLIFIVLPLAAGLMFAWAEVLGERRRA